MKRGWLLLILLVPMLSFGQRSYYGVFWQGFAQDWTYNHRLNRLTDYVSFHPERSPMAVDLCHAAASGTGTDSAFYSQSALLVRTPNAKFYPGVLTLTLEGKEGKLITAEAFGQVDYPATPPPGTQAFLLLNGFDLVSTARADKLTEWSVLPGKTPAWTAEKGWTFSYQTRLTAGCRSPECEPFNQNVSYQLELHYLLIVAEPSVSGHQLSVESSWNWDRKVEHQPTLIDFAVKGKYPEALNVMGFRGFSLRMDHEHWIQQMGMRIVKTEFDPQTRTLAGLMDCHFVEWTADRKARKAFKKFNRFSLKNSGKATFSAELLFLQFPEGRQEAFSRHGNLLWPGRNAPALGSPVDCASFPVELKD